MHLFFFVADEEEKGFKKKSNKYENKRGCNIYVYVYLIFAQRIARDFYLIMKSIKLIRFVSSRNSNNTQTKTREKIFAIYYSISKRKESHIVVYIFIIC